MTIFYQKLCRTHKPALEKQRTSKLHTDSGPPSPPQSWWGQNWGPKTTTQMELSPTPPHKKTNHSQSPKTTNLKKAKISATKLAEMCPWFCLFGVEGSCVCMPSTNLPWGFLGIITHIYPLKKVHAMISHRGRTLGPGYIQLSNLPITGTKNLSETKADATWPKVPGAEPIVHLGKCWGKYPWDGGPQNYQPYFYQPYLHLI